MDKTFIAALHNSLEQINKASPLRKGRRIRLDMGQVCAFDCNGWEAVVTNKGKCTLFNNRFSIETQVISATCTVPYLETNFKKLNQRFDKLFESFLKEEQKALDAVLGEIVFTAPEDVGRVKKFFKDLGKRVYVSGHPEEIDNNLTLVERYTPTLDYCDDSINGGLKLTLWEDVGFYIRG